MDASAHLVWSLAETFVYLELARMSELSADELLDDSSVEPWTNPQNPGDLAFGDYIFHLTLLYNDTSHSIVRQACIGH